MWRKIVDFWMWNFEDMGVHIFDTPYNALNLDVPLTIKIIVENQMVGFPEKTLSLMSFQEPNTQLIL